MSEPPHRRVGKKFDEFILNNFKLELEKRRKEARLNSLRPLGYPEITNSFLEEYFRLASKKARKRKGDSDNFDIKI